MGNASLFLVRGPVKFDSTRFAGIRKLQISNTTLGLDKSPVILRFVGQKRAGFLIHSHSRKIGLPSFAEAD
jgi:hypothetical protein